MEEYLASFWASLSLPCGMELATCTQLLKLQTCFVPRCVTQSNSWVKEYTLYFPFLSALVALHLSSVAHSLTRLYFLAGVTSLFLDQPSFECEWNKVIDSSFLCWNAVWTFPFRILLPHLQALHCAEGSTALLWIVSTEMWMTEAWFGGDTDEVDVLGIPMSVQTSRHLRPGVRGVQAGKEIPLWRWRASRGPACAVRCRGPKEIPLWR